MAFGSSMTRVEALKTPLSFRCNWARRCVCLVGCAFSDVCMPRRPLGCPSSRLRRVDQDVGKTGPESTGVGEGGQASGAWCHVPSSYSSTKEPTLVVQSRPLSGAQASASLRCL